MNFFTDSLDLPQNEQRKCLSLAMAPLVQGAPRSSAPQRPEGRAAALLLFVAHFDHLATSGDDVVDDPVFLCLQWAHEAVAVDVLRDPLDRLTGVLREDLVCRL